jgi:hypothetical protein
MAVSIDATKVREKLGQKRSRNGKKRYTIGFKDVKVAAISRVRWDSRRGEASCEDSSYVAGVEEADEFFQRIWVEMQRRGVDPENQPIVFLGDGAEWIWNRVKDLRNPNSVEILDFYHAADYLSKTCKELYGEQTPDYHAHYPRWTKLLFRGKASVVIEEFRDLLAGARSTAGGNSCGCRSATCRTTCTGWTTPGTAECTCPSGVARWRAPARTSSEDG